MWQDHIPPTLTIKRLSQEDISLFRKLIQLNDQVFEMKPVPIQDDYLRSQLRNPSFVSLAAIKGGEVIGSLTGYVLPMYRMEKSEFFLYDLAVKHEFQRQGIATKLIRAIQEYTRDQGIGDVFLDAHEEDQHALAFYRATGAKGERVIQFTYKGKDETRQRQ